MDDLVAAIIARWRKETGKSPSNYVTECFERELAAIAVKVVEPAAFRRGAEAMRQAALAWMLDYAAHHSREDYSARERGDADAAVEHRTMVDAADMILVAIRALPLPIADTQ
jgi:hypothetical protein